MKVIKRDSSEIQKEEAHGGTGSRRVFASPDHLKSAHFEAMTYGYLPGGNSFDWHDHSGVEEIMVVIKGDGEVHDEDGIYEYHSADVFVYPANVKHKIHNPTNYEHEMIFVRVKV